MARIADGAQEGVAGCPAPGDPQADPATPVGQGDPHHGRDRPWADRVSRLAGGLIRACHPEPTAAVTAGAAVLAVAVGQHAAGVVQVAATVLASQLATGWANDAIDADRDAVARRTDKPIPSGRVGRRHVGLAAAAAAAATVPLGLLSGPVAALAITVGLLGGLAYDWPLKFTPLSPLPYLVSFGALAVFVVAGLPGAPLAPAWLVAAAALLGGAAHFVNVLPDLDQDARTGVRGAPQRLGRTWSWVVAAVLLAAASAALAFGPPGRPSWLGVGFFAVAACCLPVGALAARRAGSRAAFRAVLVAAVVDVALLLLSGTKAM